MTFDAEQCFNTKFEDRLFIAHEHLAKGAREAEIFLALFIYVEFQCLIVNIKDKARKPHGIKYYHKPQNWKD